MVHALQACWRVLQRGGLLLDMRPAGLDRNIEIIAAGKHFPAGIIDVSPGRPDDVAADWAMQQVVDQGLYVRQTARTFSFTNYWDSLAEAREHVEGRWSDFAFVADETWDKANAFIRTQEGRPIRVAARGQIQMVIYRKPATME